MNRLISFNEFVLTFLMTASAIITRCLLVHMTHEHLVILRKNIAKAFKMLGQNKEMKSAFSKETGNVNLNLILKG